MFRSLFGQLQPVVKNLLIINLLFFLATIVLGDRQGIDLINLLGAHYIDSPNFQPYQLATHFFMHAGFSHLFFNLIVLLVFGNMLEKIWGGKKFLLYYFGTALGAAFLHTFAQGLEVYGITGTFTPIADNYNVSALPAGDQIVVLYNLVVPTVGASGALYGLLLAAAMLFPNQEVHLYFVFPIKIVWISLGITALAIFNAIQNAPNDSVAHYAHLGGFLFGFIFLKIWQKDRGSFY